MFRFVPGFVFGVTVALLAGGCAKGPPAENKNFPSNQSEQSVAANPHLQPTIKGDVERTSLLIAMARDSAKANRWPDAVAHLRAAKKEIETALGRNPRTRPEFEELKAAIDQTIPMLESRSENADAKLAELQTRIAGIKVKTF